MKQLDAIRKFGTKEDSEALIPARSRDEGTPISPAVNYRVLSYLRYLWAAAAPEACSLQVPETGSTRPIIQYPAALPAPGCQRIE